MQAVIDYYASRNITLRREIIEEAINRTVAKFGRNIEHKCRLLIEPEIDEIIVICTQPNTDRILASGQYRLVYGVGPGNGIVDETNVTTRLLNN